MNLLLDTSCWLWWFASPEKLNAEAIAIISDFNNKLFFSAASIWEISIKVSVGKLKLPTAPSDYIPQRMNALGMTSLDIKGHHAITAASLPQHHKDPFDRMIIAQSNLENFPVLTSDLTFKKYDVKFIWAAK